MAPDTNMSGRVTLLRVWACMWACMWVLSLVGVVRQVGGAEWELASYRVRRHYTLQEGDADWENSASLDNLKTILELDTGYGQDLRVR